MAKILGATIGNCVHVAGVMNFLSLAEKEGYEVEFLGAAVKVDELIAAVRAKKPDYVGVSYRLTPEPLREVLKELKEKIEAYGLDREIKWIFGGNEPTARVAEESGIFTKVFNGLEDIDDVIGFLKGYRSSSAE